MNELKLMAIKAKSRLLNKGLRDIYSSMNNVKDIYETKKKEKVSPPFEFMSENERKKHILNMVKNKVNRI